MQDSQALYLFHEGTNFQAHKFLGVHQSNDEYVFRVWAPHADSVEVVGDFNSWSDGWYMHKISNQGVWEIKVRIDCPDGFYYKYKITNGNIALLKSDPYAFYSETEGKSASRFWEFKDFEWSDDRWIKYTESIPLRSDSASLPIPMNVYEIHLGSFCKKENGEYLNYREYADVIANYVKRMGYTHIELMPIAEHPYGGSWGYQITSYFAPTSRFGTPDDFKYFVNKLHSCGIGIILDWVPAHFPKDEFGLVDFDGDKCYEYQAEWRSEHKGWGTRCFDVGRTEVQSFLISNALYWLEEYHVDGLRIDAVASMLYLDYDRRDSEWVPNTNGDNESLEAVSFFKKLNSVIHTKFPRAIVIAEESTEWKNVTRKSDDFGLGFDLKWNMGWMHDTLDYIKTDPYFRSGCHSKLTFSFFYAFSERFILPISHDEVVHGKRSLLDKCYGEYSEKFELVKVFYSYMIAHPGKKMTFMGCEYGQFSEWNYEKELEWFMTDFEKHGDLQLFFSEINNFYLKSSEFWENDFSWEGFQWIVSDDNEQNIIVFERINLNKDKIICVFNFSPVSRNKYRIGIDEFGKYKLILSTKRIEETLQAQKTVSHGRMYSLELTIEGYTAKFYKIEKNDDCLEII